MILDRSIEIYSRTLQTGAGTQGIPKSTYSLAFTTKASVQPAALNEDQIAQMGITTLAADAKTIFIPGIKNIGLSWLIKDLKTTNRYEVRGTNPWVRHTEIIGIPYQGKDPV